MGRVGAPARLAVAAALLWIAGNAGAAPADYVIDPEHVTVAFLVPHIGYAKVLGQFREVEGKFSFDEETAQLTGVEVTVAAGSVFTNHDERDEHLRSDDFLNARRFPTLRFTATGARAVGEREFAVDGELELLGVRRPLTLTATWNKSDKYPIGRNAYVMGISARGTVKRSEFGMSYGVDNGWVGDAVEILIEFEARRQ